jgi:hypothetical protein
MGCQLRWTRRMSILLLMNSLVKKRRERRGVLAHLHHREGAMRFLDDESDDHDSGDSEEEDVKKGKIKAPPRRLFLKQKGSGDSIGSDIFPEESPIDDLRAQAVDEKVVTKVKSKSKGVNYGKDPKDVKFSRVARLPYKLRWKEKKKPIIEHQITCGYYYFLVPSVCLWTDDCFLFILLSAMLNRHEFLLGGVGHCFAWHVRVHFSIEMIHNCKKKYMACGQHF